MIAAMVFDVVAATPPNDRQQPPALHALQQESLDQDSSSTLVETSKLDGGSLIRLRLGSEAISPFHVPKTGGTSLIHELHSSFPNEGVDAAAGIYERCLSALPSTDFVVTMLRSPRSHVISQYEECRYDPWGQHHTTDDFPRRGRAQDDFVEWLGHFSPQRWQVESGDFNCYNPFNMQARSITCVEDDEHHAVSDSLHGGKPYLKCNESPVHHVWRGMPTSPDDALAVSQLDRKARFVGILELYEESWCLLNYQLRRILPAHCSCDGYGVLADLLKHERLSTPAHGEEGSLDVSEFNSSTIAAIDAITAMDHSVYQAALTRFFAELRDLEKATDATLICPNRIEDRLKEAGWNGPPTSPIDRRPKDRAGSGKDHYSTLSKWLNVTGMLDRQRVYSFDMTGPNQHLGPRVLARWDELSDKDFATLCPTMRQDIDTLNDAGRGLRAFVWSAVELRLFREAHQATVMAHPPAWFDPKPAGGMASSDGRSGSACELQPLTEEARNRLTVLTFESLSRHANRSCFVLRDDARSSQSISVPYPTSFHPTSEAAFDRHLEWVHRSTRPHLAVLYASLHGKGPDGSELRTAIDLSCLEDSSCVNLLYRRHYSTTPRASRNGGPYLDGTGTGGITLLGGDDGDGRKDAHVSEAFADRLANRAVTSEEDMELSNGEVHAELRDSIFCLEPQGDTPMRSQVFECLLCGTIPVFFSSCARPDLVFERIYEPFLPPYERTAFGPGLWAVVLDSERAMSEPTYVMDALRAIALNTTAIAAMRKVITAAMPRLVYPSTEESAVSWTRSARYQPDALGVLRSILVDRDILEEEAQPSLSSASPSQQQHARGADEHKNAGWWSP